MAEPLTAEHPPAADHAFPAEQFHARSHGNFRLYYSADCARCVPAVKSSSPFPG